ncbi:Gfo/Idh/MocA family protein [Chitinolyticbacter meiyuanensis]|uniref:Gfo/Idh/MocA family protein n=1 Tax=Chitinolyticbacter meiyuanensis TaxID=682798 RepID=UPI0011E5DECB|nr:Gfo/Idh/MocA family oxidoreductase [Chitinolyticbacter meiyuanensis]
MGVARAMESAVPERETLKPLRVGLLGCGVAARELHWPALQKLAGRIQLVAVCNRTGAKAQAFADLVGGIDWYEDWQQLLARTDIDAVDIVLPATLNLAATRDALAAGKHVLVEKPLAATPADALAMQALADRYPQLVTMVAENYRYAWFVERLRAWIASGEAGRPYALHWNAMSRMAPDNRYIISGWRSSDAFPDGLLLDAGVHYVAVVRALLGEITRATLLPSRVQPHLGRFDGGSLQFQTETGAHGSLNLYFSAVGSQEWRLQLLAEHGCAEYDGTCLRIRTLGGETVEQRPDDDGYAAEFQAFADAVAGKAAHRSGFDEAWRDMQVISQSLAQPGVQQSFGF